MHHGLRLSSYIQADDTGARHAGETGYCTHIGNELFAWFESTASKSRINFLELLSQSVERHYVINEGALEYMQHQQLPRLILEQLEDKPVCHDSVEAWQKWLEQQDYTATNLSRDSQRRVW